MLAERDAGDVHHEVLAVPRVPGIGERFEVRGDGADIDELGRGRHILGSARVGHPTKGVRQADHNDRVKEIETRPVAPDCSICTVMRAGPG